MLDRTVEDPGRPYLRSVHIPLAGEAINDIHLRRDTDSEAGLVSLEIVDRLTEATFRYRSHASEIYQSFYASKLF